MNETELEEGLSFGEMMRLILKKTKLVVIVTLAIALAFTLVVALVFNMFTMEYQMSYSLGFPGFQTQRYPDGTAFRYQDIVSLESLRAVKNSDSSFSSIAVSKIAEENDARVTVETRDVSGVKVPTGRFTISIKASYFTGEGQATRFIQALALRPVNYINSVMDDADYSYNLTAYEEALTYGEKISYLAAQRDYLLKKYDGLIATYGESYRYDGKSLKAYQASIVSLFGASIENSFTSELQVNGYVFNEETSQLRLQTLHMEKLANENELVALQEQLALFPNLDTTEVFSQKVVALTERNAQITMEIKSLEENLGDTSSKEEEEVAFVSRLTSRYNGLYKATGDLKNVNKFIYSSESTVLFDSYEVETTGAMSIVLAILGGLAIGFVVACVVGGFVAVPQYYKSLKAASEETEEKKENA